MHHRPPGQLTVKTVSYFVSEGPGSSLKNRGYHMGQSLFIARQLGSGDSALCLYQALQNNYMI